jgi:hypothetical protein
MLIIPTFRGLRWQDFEIQVSLGYRARPYLKNQNKQQEARLRIPRIRRMF